MNRISILLMFAVAMLAAVGCWQEVRYEPEQEPAIAKVSEVAQVDASDENENGSEPTDSAVAPAGERQVIETTEELVAEPIAEPEGMADEATADDDLDWLEETPESKPTLPLASAWKLGSKWSLAVCIYGSGYGEEKYSKEFDAASAIANEWQLELPALPDESLVELSKKQKTDRGDRRLNAGRWTEARRIDERKALVTASGAVRIGRRVACLAFAVSTEPRERRTLGVNDSRSCPQSGAARK